MKIIQFLSALTIAVLLSASAHAFSLFNKKDAAAANAPAASETKPGTKPEAAAAPVEKDPAPDSYQSDRFKAYDLNKDGKISQEEFTKDIVDQFKSKDENKDGKLSPDEFEFSPGTPVNIKVIMRKNLERQDEQMKKMREDQEKRHAEDMKRMQEEAKKAQEKAKEQPAAKPVPEAAEKAAAPAKTAPVPEATEKSAAPAKTVPKAVEKDSE
jgi:hypothetical protein